MIGKGRYWWDQSRLLGGGLCLPDQLVLTLLILLPLCTEGQEVHRLWRYRQGLARSRALRAAAILAAPLQVQGVVCRGADQCLLGHGTDRYACACSISICVCVHVQVRRCLHVRLCNARSLLQATVCAAGRAAIWNHSPSCNFV